MVLSESADDELCKMHQDLCSKLNLDASITAAAWETFYSINKKFVLEGEKLQWLGCSIYVASRGVEVPTLDSSSVVHGNGLNLTSLLRHSNLSFAQFFANITRWADMAQLPDDFRNKIAHLRSNFSVAYNTFKKFHPLYADVFIPPIANAQDLEAAKHRNRKNRAIPCTSQKVFDFIWNMFILMKAEEPSCSTELIKSHHLLYCCIDLAFKNAVAAERRDLLNSSLADEMLQYTSGMKAVTEVPCMVKRFVKCESVIKEALHMKVYTFRELVIKLIDNKTLIADETDFTGLFDPENFDQNYRNLTKAYDTHLLSHGDFDEKIFLAELKRVLMEKEQSTQSWTNIKNLPPSDSSIPSLLDSPKNGTGAVTPVKGFDTPLTGRRYLTPRENDIPDKSINEKVSRLHTLIGNRNAGPSEQLKAIFDACEHDPLSKIQQMILVMKERFITGYTSIDFPLNEAQNRLDYTISLFYKYLELIFIKEANIGSHISTLAQKEIFYQCLFACCLEIVLYCYNFPIKFPWVLEILEVQAIHFVKVIELIIRCKDNLFRELIKHLNRIEETIIESLAWKSDSPIWEAIEKSGQEVPKFQDIALPGSLLYSDVSNEHMLQSPGGPSVMDYFQSPVSQVCKNLFPSNNQASLQLQKPTAHLIMPSKDGIKFIPIMENNEKKVDIQQGSPGTRPDPQAAALPRRTGSLSIIFRKFYYLAGVRMQHLCSNLGFADFDLKRKIWTIFEDSIRHTDLIKDRHLDQLLMCAIYVICKACDASKIQNLFSVIMKFYRQQPQSSSSVYRDVLIEREQLGDNGELIPEERKDLIYFYNSVYVKAMQSYAIRFQPSSNPNSNIFLSPLPASRMNLVSSNTQVVGNVFVKPLETSNVQPGSTFNYYFSRSPSKDLKNINKAINGVQGKRLLIDGDDMPSGKRICNRKIQSLVEDRIRQSKQ